MKQRNSAVAIAVIAAFLASAAVAQPTGQASA